MEVAKGMNRCEECSSYCMESCGSTTYLTYLLTAGAFLLARYYCPLLSMPHPFEHAPSFLACPINPSEERHFSSVDSEWCIIAGSSGSLVGLQRGLARSELYHSGASPRRETKASFISHFPFPIHSSIHPPLSHP